MLREGFISGEVLDVGCGVGDNSIFLAEKGLKVVGIDYVGKAIQIAKSKALKAHVSVEFLKGNALKLEELNKTFDTVIDSGLFHTFSDVERLKFKKSLEAILKKGGNYIMLCFSNLEKGSYGPRRIKKEEIRNLFRDNWSIQDIRPEIFESTWGKAKGWLSIIKKL